MVQKTATLILYLQIRRLSKPTWQVKPCGLGQKVYSEPVLSVEYIELNVFKCDIFRLFWSSFVCLLKHQYNFTTNKCENDSPFNRGWESNLQLSDMSLLNN